MTMNDNLMAIMMIMIVVILIFILVALKSFNSWYNNNIKPCDNLSRCSKLSMISEKGECEDNDNLCFKMSTIFEEDYKGLESDRISIAIMIEIDGKISAIL